MDCLFCGIIDKKIPSNIVDENEHVLAFHDIHPMADVHVLVVPKLHVSNINELCSENMHYVGHMMVMAKKIAEQFHVSRSGYRVVFNTEKGAGQTVFHLHAHILGGRSFSWPPG